MNKKVSVVYYVGLTRTNGQVFALIRCTKSFIRLRKKLRTKLSLWWIQKDNMKIIRQLPKYKKLDLGNMLKEIGGGVSATKTKMKIFLRMCFLVSVEKCNNKSRSIIKSSINWSFNCTLYIFLNNSFTFLFIGTIKQLQQYLNSRLEHDLLEGKPYKYLAVQGQMLSRVR